MLERGIRELKYLLYYYVCGQSERQIADWSLGVQTTVSNLVRMAAS